MDSYIIKFDKNKISHSPQKSPYWLDKKLGKAVEVAISLGMPLLLTGEPGTGKTKLAEKIARDLHASDPSFLPEPLVFNAKTTSTAKDLFYSYDALSHFHDANIQKHSSQESEKQAIHASDYIQLQALGKAIALTNSKEIKGTSFIEAHDYPRSSVVLIDEIDKAPRDFPNDILSEIEEYSFRIKEANNHLISKGFGQQIVLVMTSNSEKNLPDAFLRRTIFYHIDFPDTEHLIKIVNSHLRAHSNLDEEEQQSRQKSIRELIKLFQKARTILPRKKPATAELIAWIRMLEMQGLFLNDFSLEDIAPQTESWHILQRSYSILAKTQIDLKVLEEMKFD